MIRILIVDDDRTVCRCLSELIQWEPLGYDRPQIAYNGSDALELIASGFVPEVIITDIRMPEMGGVELVQRIRENHPDIQIFFFSAFEDFEAARAGISFRVRGYMLKPINRDSLTLLERNLRETAQELAAGERRRALLGEVNDRAAVFERISSGDTDHFGNIFSAVAELPPEQAHSVCVLYENLLNEYAQQNGLSALNSLRLARRCYSGPLPPETPSEWQDYILLLYSGVCGRQENPSDGWSDILVEKLQKYALEHYSEPDLSLSAIAEEFKYSAKYISKVFAAKTGTTLSDFISEVRMNRAAELLRDSHASVASAAKLSGYYDPKYFAKAFRRHFGVSPAQYRKSFM